MNFLRFSYNGNLPVNIVSSGLLSTVALTEKQLFVREKVVSLSVSMVCMNVYGVMLHRKQDFTKGLAYMDGTLIVYYSLFHNTENLALEIAIQTGGTLRELIPDKNYSFDYNTAAKEVRNQISRRYTPGLLSGHEPIEAYRTIFIGTPNWFKTMAPPVLCFLMQHDFTSKTVIPFCTHGGGGFGQIEKDISKECAGSILLPGLAVNGTAASEDVTNWLERIGCK